MVQYLPSRSWIGVASSVEDIENGHPRNKCVFWDADFIRLKHTMYNLLTRLGSDTIEKFHVSKLLRTMQTDVSYLFLLWRLSHHLGEPFRTRSQSQLRLILQFKGTGPPPPNVPMRLQILSDSMHDQIKPWLLGFFFHHAVQFPPFHKVRAPFVRIRNRTLGQVFFTFRSTLTWWTPDDEPQCQCHLFPIAIQQRPRKTEHISAFAHECYPDESIFTNTLLRKSHLLGPVFFITIHINSNNG